MEADQILEQLVDDLLKRCEEERVSPRKMLLHLAFRDLCDRLDEFSRNEQREFVARLCDRYLTND